MAYQIIHFQTEAAPKQVTGLCSVLQGPKYTRIHLNIQFPLNVRASVCLSRFPLVSSSPAWQLEPLLADCWVQGWSSWPTTTMTGLSLKGGALQVQTASLRGFTRWLEQLLVQVSSGWQRSFALLGNLISLRYLKYANMCSQNNHKLSFKVTTIAGKKMK